MSKTPKPNQIGPIVAYIMDTNISGHLTVRYDSLYDLMHDLERFSGLWHDWTGEGVALLSEPTAWVYLSDPGEDGYPFPDYIVELNYDGTALYYEP